MTIGNVKEVQLSKMPKHLKHKRLSNGNLTKELKNGSVSLIKSGCKINGHRNNSVSNNNSDDDIDVDIDNNTDSNESFTSRNSLIDDEAFEKSNDEESIVSTDSNEIIDHGESIESSFSNNDGFSDDTYERTSFLCSDDSVIESLLSDSDDEVIRKPTRRRVQLLSDSSSDADNNAKKRNITEINSKSNVSNHIKIISDKQLSLKTVEKNVHNESDMKCVRSSDKDDKLELKSNLNDNANNVNSEFFFDSSEDKLEIRIHLPAKITNNLKCRKRKRNQVSEQSTDAIEPPLSPCPSSVISNTPSTSTTSSISLLRKKIKEKYRNENLRHMGKFRIRNVPKHQSRNQMSDKLFLVKNRLRTPVKY